MFVNQQLPSDLRATERKGGDRRPGDTRLPAHVILRYGLLPSFLYDLGKPTGDGKSSVNEAIHTAREAVFSAGV